MRKPKRIDPYRHDQLYYGMAVMWAPLFVVLTWALLDRLFAWWTGL